MFENLVELAYSKYSSHYSKKNWFANCPLFSELPDEDKEFWREFCKGIRGNFKTDDKPTDK